ncbi:MAG: hypothetical protein LBV44_07815 [Methylobacillus sp.]|nr:hypothetical protein [Methylobacillus sp.]
MTNKLIVCGIALFFAVMPLAECGAADGEPDVYIVGNDDNGAALWKNGVKQKFDLKGVPIPLFVHVSGNDIYVAGGDGNPVLWKNGVTQKLGDGKEIGHASSVYVSGSNVYVAGTLGFDVVLWKNGAIQKLPMGFGGDAHFVYASGSDVYVLGHNMDNRVTGVTWKNGVAQIWNRGSSVASVYVSGDDVYFAGSVNMRSGAKNISVATLWKNGVAQKLSDESHWAIAKYVYVSGNDVYVAGTEYIAPDTAVATLWKNGVAQKLTSGSRDESAEIVYTSGDDVYVAGFRGRDGYKDVMFWKNGKVRKIFKKSISTDLFNSVFIK